MKLLIIGFVLFLPSAPWSADLPPNRASTETADEIMQRSVAATNADWDAAPQYDFTERDIVTQHGKRTTKTYQVMMIDGTPYNKLIAVNGQSLPAAQAAEQERKLEGVRNRRGKESSSETEKRIAEYQKERRQDHELMAQMAKGFEYKLAGEETVDGRRCFVLDATPKPGYAPPNRDTEVLKGMRGTMWVDTQTYQWVKVHAEVFRPVTFGLFIAQVKPGTQFTLENVPVRGNLWLPSHFSMALKARVFVASRHSTDDETYTNYHPAAAAGKSASQPLNSPSQRQKE